MVSKEKNANTEYNFYSFIYERKIMEIKFIVFKEIIIEPNPDGKTAKISEVERRIVPEQVHSLLPVIIPNKIVSPIPKQGTAICLPGERVMVRYEMDEVEELLNGRTSIVDKNLN